MCTNKSLFPAGLTLFHDQDAASVGLISRDHREVLEANAQGAFHLEGFGVEPENRAMYMYITRMLIQ